MRFRGWYKTSRAGWPFLVVTFVGSPLLAQFREIAPQEPKSAISPADMAPTLEHFVPPKRTESQKLEPIPATDTQLGTPTLAEPPAATTGSPAVAVPSAAAPTPAAPTTAVPSAAAPTVTAPTAAPVNVPSPPAAVVPAGQTIAVPATSSDPFAAFQRAGQPDGVATPSPQQLSRVAALTFNQVTPGATAVAEVEALWGPAAKTVVEGSGKRLIYRAPGFRQVDLMTDADVAAIDSVLVHLAEPVAASDLAEHLGLTATRPVEITDDQGGALGRGYPERGVLLTYEPASDGQQVSHISLEPIRGELYRLRAETDTQHRYADSLADLDEAIRLNPQDAKSYWLQAELYSLIGRSQDALQSAAEAVRIVPDHPLYQLTKARLSAGNGALAEAIGVTRTLADDEQIPAIVRARAQYQLGNLSALGPSPDLQAALNHHLKAIDLAGKHAAVTNVEVRRMAKDLLVDAHLAVAQDVALGNFQRQREVVPKWLTRATELAEKYIADDQGDESVRMEIYRTTLAVYSVLEGNFDASIATEEAIKEGQRLVTSAADRQYQYQIERELSESLYHAAKIEHRCGRSAAAMKYASHAISLLESGQQAWQPSLFDQLMAGQLYFFTGSLHAVQSQNHVEAVKMYEKSLPAFNDERLVDLVDSNGLGDLFVSMGVSYWETGNRERAVELTQGGAQLMQQGVAAGTIDALALSVPYGNLAAMYEQMGNAPKAQEYSALMAKAESPASATSRR